MAPVSFSENLSSRQFTYMLHTSTNGISNKIISSVFRDGQIVLASNLSFHEDLSENSLQELVEQFHQKKLMELRILFELIEQYSETDNIKIVELIGKALLRKNLADEAIHFVSNFEKVLGQDDLFLKLIGTAYLQNDDLQSAVQALSKAVAAKPNYADYHNLLGIAYLKQNVCSMAALEFKAAIKINLYFSEAYYHLGLALIKNAFVRDDYELSLNLVENSKNALESAAKINPSYMHAGFQDGIEALHAEEFEKSFFLFEEALQKIPKRDCRILIDEFYLKLLHSPEDVDIVYIWDYIKKLNALSKQYPAYADIYNDIGVAYSLLGAYFQKESTEFFEKALEKNAKYRIAKRNQKLVRNENRGQDYLLETLLGLHKSDSEIKKRGIKILFS